MQLAFHPWAYAHGYNMSPHSGLKHATTPQPSTVMLTLTLKSPLTLPIDVDGVLPENVINANVTEVGNLLVWCGKQQLPLRNFFDISGSAAADSTIQWQSCSGSNGLVRVNRIGHDMTSGKMRIRGDVGLQTGWRMQGGHIEVHGNADDYLGAEMTGGTIVVSGDVGDHAGSRFNGEKIGMNRGQIFIQGSAGNGLGQGMRRGTIVVGKRVGKLVGWNMLAGTIICLQGCGPYPGAGMKRGTIIAAADPQATLTIKKNDWLLPSFNPGATSAVPIFKPIKKWLAAEKIDDHPVFSTEQLGLLDQAFQVFHGDQLSNGRGEVFLAAS